MLLLMLLLLLLLAGEVTHSGPLELNKINWDPTSLLDTLYFLTQFYGGLELVNIWP